MTQTTLIFDGPDLTKKDMERLGRQLDKVFHLMSGDGEWRTLREIVDAIGGGTETGISARLRDIAKPMCQKRFGPWKKERRRRTQNGLWEYRVVRQ